jgi:succinyl-CoA synthetase alpha subunit
VAIFVDETTRVVYQGLTGSQGRFYGLLNREYGTQVVAGTNPRKAGSDVDGIPVYASVADAVGATGATASCIFIPAPGVRDAVIEAAEGGVTFIVCITEGVPAHDEAWFFNKLRRDFPNVRLLGPNCPGIISPGKANIGITAGHIAKAPAPGETAVGIVSRSGTLTYQALYELKLNDIGVSTCVGIGGDPVPGTSFIDCLEAFEADPDTHAVMMIGEIGGSAEEEAAEYVASKMTKPVVAYIAGVTAPPGKKMGHAGAIVSGGKGTAQAKMDALRDAGARVGLNPTAAGGDLDRHGELEPPAIVVVGNDPVECPADAALHVGGLPADLCRGPHRAVEHRVPEGVGRRHPVGEGKVGHGDVHQSGVVQKLRERGVVGVAEEGWARRDPLGHGCSRLADGQEQRPGDRRAFGMVPGGESHTSVVGQNPGQLCHGARMVGEVGHEEVGHRGVEGRVRQRQPVRVALTKPGGVTDRSQGARCVQRIACAPQDHRRRHRLAEETRDQRRLADAGLA